MSTILVIAAAACVMMATVGIAVYIVVRQRRSRRESAMETRTAQALSAPSTRLYAGPQTVDAGVLIGSSSADAMEELDV